MKHELTETEQAQKKSDDLYVEINDRLKKAMQIEGSKIILVREMTAREMKAEGWGCLPCQLPPVVLVLDSGAKLFASQDEEGNGPGSLFGSDKNSSFQLIARRTK